jgi:hypothetical protein
VTVDPIGAAWREFEATVARARVSLDRVRAQPVHTPEERRELHRDALSGVLGRDMQQLAEHVEAGRTSWGEAFEGDSPYSSLLRGHIDRMVETHQEALRQAIEDDDDFDPWAADPQV